MRLPTMSLLFILFFYGCGGETTQSFQNITSNQGQTTSSHSSDAKVKKTKPTKNQIGTTYDSTFATIKGLIRDSKEGNLHDVTYICIGDSTRAYTVIPKETHPHNIHNHSEKIFKTIQDTLQRYNVTSYLISQGGLEFKTFLGEKSYFENDTRDDWLYIQEAIDLIPENGDHTIVDISLGVNDISGLLHLFKASHPEEYAADPTLPYPYINNELKTLLVKTIQHIQKEKPNVKIMLTSPNPYRDWKRANDVSQDVYATVAKELQLPYANFTTVMPPYGTSEYKNWYNDGIHFDETVGMTQVANYTLEQLLPTQ